MKHVEFCGIDSKDRAEEHDEELVGSNVDGGGGEDKSAEIQPCRSPAPSLPAEERTPMIKPASGRKCGSDVSHAKRNEKREEDANGPNDTCRCAADCADAELERSDAASEDADD